MGGTIFGNGQICGNPSGDMNPYTTATAATPAVVAMAQNDRVILPYPCIFCMDNQ
jgi:hypothetical protein